MAIATAKQPKAIRWIDKRSMREFLCAVTVTGTPRQREVNGQASLREILEHVPSGTIEIRGRCLTDFTEMEKVILIASIAS
jgi:hypothetical protein